MSPTSNARPDNPVMVSAQHPLHARTSLGEHLRHLLGFARGNIKQLNQRLNLRYRPAPDFPLTVTLYLASGSWTTVLQDISGTGVGVVVDPRTPMSAGRSARVILEIDHHRMDIKARIAHMEPREGGLFAGLELKFADFPTHKAYLELMHPVVIGQSLRPVNAPQALDGSGLIRQCYQGESDFSLMVWREDTAAAPLHSVEFRMHHYSWQVVRPPDAPPGWIPPPAPPDLPKPDPIFDCAGGLQFEVHELFRWVAFNLSDAVPEDVRTLVHPYCD